MISINHKVGHLGPTKTKIQQAVSGKCKRLVEIEMGSAWMELWSWNNIMRKVIIDVEHVAGLHIIKAARHSIDKLSK